MDHISREYEAYKSLTCRYKLYAASHCCRAFLKISAIFFMYSALCVSKNKKEEKLVLNEKVN
jgi:hypothetical protein